MPEVLQGKNKMIIKSEPMFMGMGIVAVFMSLVGFWLLFGIIEGFLYYRTEYGIAVPFGFLFNCLWLAVVFRMAFYGFKTGSQQITIDADGILCKTWFGKKIVKWSDIKDWGLSYCGQTRGEGNTYYLYFSEHECEVKNECRKKLKGKMIKVTVFEDDYSKAVYNKKPFCREKTSVVPCVGKDKYHFI